MGVRGIALQWISYLSNRMQYVSFQNENSLYGDVVCGVPQGSILGPLLFMKYNNDICNTSDSFRFILFADDTTIVSAQSILRTKILNSLYCSLVEPHFTHCVEVWGYTYRSYLQSLY